MTPSELYFRAHRIAEQIRSPKIDVDAAEIRFTDAIVRLCQESILDERNSCARIAFDATQAPTDLDAQKILDAIRAREETQ